MVHNDVFIDNETLITPGNVRSVFLVPQERYGPLGMVHIDAHSDTSDTMLGEKIAHGTPFRRAVEEGCLDPHRVIQIGLRGSTYSVEDYDWARNQVKGIMGKRCHKNNIQGRDMKVEAHFTCNFARIFF